MFFVILDILEMHALNVFKYRLGKKNPTYVSLFLAADTNQVSTRANQAAVDVPIELPVNCRIGAKACHANSPAGPRAPEEPDIQTHDTEAEESLY